MSVFHFRRWIWTAPVALALVGCSEKSGVEEKTTVTSPEGTSTITKKIEVKKSGEDAPPITTTPEPVKNP